MSGIGFGRAVSALEQIRLPTFGRTRGTSRRPLAPATLIQQDPSGRAKRVRLASSPEPPKIFASERLSSIKLARGEAGIGSIKDQGRWNLLNRHLLEVAKPILEATSHKTELGQMEVRFSVMGVDSQDFL